MTASLVGLLVDAFYAVKMHGPTKDTQGRAQDLIQQALRKVTPVEVADRLPDDEAAVLAFNGAWSSVVFSEMTDGEPRGGEFVDSYTGIPVENVTHWLPLPDAPMPTMGHVVR